jgi:hypothetical protein
MDNLHNVDDMVVWSLLELALGKRNRSFKPLISSFLLCPSLPFTLYTPDRVLDRLHVRSNTPQWHFLTLYPKLNQLN